MSVTLATLPEDVLLSLLELGNVDAAEALSLRWTCKSLFRLSEQAPYWTIVGKTIRRHDPLPLPPFRTFEQLNPSEARETIVRHLKTKTNLESEEPRFKRHRVISFPAGSSRLTHFGFLPGGRWAVTIQDDGTISVFDFSVNVTRRNGLESGMMGSSLPLPEDVGRVVGVYSLGFPVFVFDFRMNEDDNGRHVIVAISSYAPRYTRSTTVVVVRFDLDDTQEGQVLARQLCRAVLPVDYTYPLTLGGNLVVVLGQRRAFNIVQPPVLIAMDWGRNRVVQIDIPCLQNDPPTVDGLDFAVQDDNILLYRYRQGDQLEIYTYFNISSRMQPLSTLTPGENPERIPPDSWATMDVALPPVLPNDPWSLLHICNTPSISTLQRVPIMVRTTRRPQTDSRADESTITSLVWLELGGMLARLREGQFQRGEKAPKLEQFIEGHGYYSDSKRQTTHGWLKSDVGTCGRHVLWIREEIIAHEEEGVQEDGDAAHPRMMPIVEMIKLPFVGEEFDEETTSKSSRRLQVPLDINQRMALTSRALYNLSEKALFWIIITRNACRLDPLPLPAFRSLETLSASEAREIWLRYLKTKRNLESDTPRYLNHRVLSLPQGTEWLSHFGFLPGGKLGITIQDDGTISIYDFSIVKESDGLTTPAPSHQAQTEVGSLISAHCVWFPVDLFDFRLGDDEGKHLIVGVSSYAPFGLPEQQTTVAVIRFDLSAAPGDPTSPKELCQTTLGIDYAQPVVLRGDLFVMMGLTRSGGQGGHKATLVAIDYKKSLIFQLEDTYLDLMVSPSVWRKARRLFLSISVDIKPDSASKLDFTVENDNILLYRFTREMNLELYAYFNTSQYMQSLDDSRRGHAPNRVRPDAQALVDIKPSVPLPLNCNWVPLHICGTPNTPTGHVPLIARSFTTRSTNPNQEAMTCLAWIDVQNVINHLRNNRIEGDREVKVPLETLVKDHSYYNHGKDLQPGMEIGWTKYEVGTCGRHAFWINQETVPIGNTDDESGEENGATITRPVVEIVSLPFVGQLFNEEETKKSVRRLQLPVDVTDDMAMLKFCDEWGMLAYMKSSEQEIQEIHIFDY